MKPMLSNEKLCRRNGWPVYTEDGFARWSIETSWYYDAPCFDPMKPEHYTWIGTARPDEAAHRLQRLRDTLDALRPATRARIWAISDRKGRYFVRVRDPDSRGPVDLLMREIAAEILCVGWYRFADPTDVIVYARDVLEPNPPRDLDTLEYLPKPVMNQWLRGKPLTPKNGWQPYQLASSLYDTTVFELWHGDRARTGVAPWEHPLRIDTPDTPPVEVFREPRCVVVSVNFGDG